MKQIILLLKRLLSVHIYTTLNVSHSTYIQITRKFKQNCFVSNILQILLASLNYTVKLFERKHKLGKPRERIAYMTDSTTLRSMIAVSEIF